MLEMHINELSRRNAICVSICICNYYFFLNFLLLPLTLELKQKEFHTLKEAELHTKCESHIYKICGKCNDQKFTQKGYYFECHFSFST